MSEFYKMRNSCKDFWEYDRILEILSVDFEKVLRKFCRDFEEF